MEFHVGKNMKTPWIHYGIPCGILHGITVEHDGSPWSFLFLPMWNSLENLPWKFMERFPWKDLHDV